MSTGKFVATLKQIEALAEEALKEVGARTSAKRGAVRKKASVKAVSENALPDHILRLRDDGFFNPPKTPAETHSKLQPVYSCDPNRVAMALLRIQKRKLLRRTSKRVGKKKQIAYGW